MDRATPSEFSDSSRAPANEVRVEVLTSYEAMGRFSTELVRLVTGTAQAARLDADVFD